MTSLQIAGEVVNYNPAIVLNSGRLAARAAQTIGKREDWQHIKRWCVWQHNDDEGNRTTQVLIEELGTVTPLAWSTVCMTGSTI